MTLKPRASSNASGTTTIRNAPARSPNATPIPPTTRMSTSIPGSVSSRRISVRGHSPSVAGSTRLSFKTVQTVEPLKNETPPRTRVMSLTPSKKTPQSLSRSPSASSVLPSLKSPSISLTTPSPQNKMKLNSSSTIMSTPPSKFSLNNTENSSTTTPSKPKLPLYSSPTHIKHPNTPGSKRGSPATKNSFGRKSAAALLLADDNNSLVLSRQQPKTTALTSSNGTGTVVATDDGWLSGIGVGNGDAFWEADDDMSLEMLTDVNDGNVDEEVSF